ncbi:MAG: hypothetical protein IJ088_00585 [Clostridia bacterium]|nr:hypothetical protein [Clostridia bacterium]
MAHKKVRSKEEIQSEAADQLREVIHEYFAAFNPNSGDEKPVPTISEIEELLGGLESKTEEIFRKMTSDLLKAAKASKRTASETESEKTIGQPVTPE